MENIVAGKWLKHLNSTAYGKVIRVYKNSVRVHYDNGFEQSMTKSEFLASFEVTSKSEKMNEVKNG